MFQRKYVNIWGDNKTIIGAIEFSASEPFKLRLIDKHTGKLNFSCKSSDLFNCLVMLREQYLEKKNLMVQCNGARRDVYPSRMSRQMSGGLKAYRLRLGQPAERSQLLDIFDSVEDLSNIATVKEQKEFYQKWLSSF